VWIPRKKKGESGMVQRGKGAAKEEVKERDVRRTFKILRKV